MTPKACFFFFFCAIFYLIAGVSCSLDRLTNDPGIPYHGAQRHGMMTASLRAIRFLSLKPFETFVHSKRHRE